MSRAGLSASRFDDGWDWIDPQRDGDPAVDGDAWAGQAYYDWSQTGDFRESLRPRTRTRSRALRAVPDAELHPRPTRAARPDRVERPVRAASVDRVERPRSDYVERRTRTPRPVAAAPVRAAVQALEPIVETPSSTPAGARRTVTITGRGAEGHLWASPRRPAERPYERAGFRPDRIAMWAVLLGVLMILAAATSAHAALLHP